MITRGWVADSPNNFEGYEGNFGWLERKAIFSTHDKDGATMMTSRPVTFMGQVVHDLNTSINGLVPGYGVGYIFK